MKIDKERLRRAVQKMSGDHPAKKQDLGKQRTPTTQRTPTVPDDVEEDLKDVVCQEVLDDTPEDVLFLDLETTGLRADRSLAAMIGFLYRKGAVLHLSQWYAGNTARERFQLERLRETMRHFREIVTYNGDGFDIPFLQKRWQWHRLATDCPLESNDLLPQIRRRYRSEWPNCRLVTAEERLLGLPRSEDDVPGSEAPLRFQDLREGAPLKVIEPIYLHNRQDLISLTGLRSTLRKKILCS